MIKLRLFLFTLVLSVLSACATTQTNQDSTIEQHKTSSAQVSAETIQIIMDIPFKNGLAVSDAVKNECDLGAKISDFTKSFSDDSNLNVIQVSNPDPNKGRILTVQITDVIGTGGGAWSGSKSIRVSGELTDKGTLIGSFTGSRHSGGGAFAAYKGTCAILGRCTKALGKDIANWLKNPTMNASLGDG